MLFRSNNDNYFLLSNNIEPVEPRCFRKQYKKVLLDAGINFKKYHTLRHTFATNLIEKGADPKSVSELLGHSKIHTTLDLYVHPSLEKLKNTIELI